MLYGILAVEGFSGLCAGNLLSVIVTFGLPGIWDRASQGASGIQKHKEDRDCRKPYCSFHLHTSGTAEKLYV
jgi:hypothetical protein